MLPSSVSIHIGDEPLVLRSYSGPDAYVHIGKVSLAFESLDQLEARVLELADAIAQLKAERAALAPVVVLLDCRGCVQPFSSLPVDGEFCAVDCRDRAADAQEQAALRREA